MAKPRIIIADTDVNYMFSLQKKFVQDFYDKIDLELISNEAYFSELFATPQKADVLIVSESLYETKLHRHNLGTVFLMTEQYDEGQTDELNVNCIFKYTSIDTVFNEIISKSPESLQQDANVKKEPQIILVYSASGGVGKTTVALGISACLTQSYKRVLYVNAERLQSFQQMLINKSPISAGEVYAKLAMADEHIYGHIKHVLRKEAFTYLPPFKAALMSLNINYDIFEKIATSAKNSMEYDFIVIDADSVFDEEKANLMNVADKVIIVTDQTIKSVYATNLLATNINGVDSEKYIFVCNNFQKDKPNALISPDVLMKFTINDYIENINHYENAKLEDLAQESGIQKTAFLVI